MTTQQDSVDVERLRAAAEALVRFTEHSGGCALYWDRYGSKWPSCNCGVEAARAELTAALSLPITQRDEQGPSGTFACPICGDDKPHHHTPAVVDAYQNKRSRS